MASKDVVKQAEGELQKLKERHEEITVEVSKAEGDFRLARGKLGKRILTGEGSLTDLTSDLTKKEGEIRGLQAAHKESMLRIEQAEQAVRDAKIEVAKKEIEQAHKDFYALNSSAGDVLKPVYERLDELQVISKKAADAFSSIVSTLPVPEKQPLEFKSRALQKSVKQLRNYTDRLYQALGG